MSKWKSFLALSVFTVGCAHTGSRDPAAANAGGTCTLLNKNTSITTEPVAGTRPIYRVYDENTHASFLTVDRGGCLAAGLGFSSDDQPEGYVPVADASDDAMTECRVSRNPASLKKESKGEGQVIHVSQPRSGFSALTVDEVPCAMQGLVIDDTASEMK